jgi:DNA polymerase
MSEFDQALGYVHGVLSHLKGCGVNLVVPAAKLQELAALATAQPRANVRQEHAAAAAPLPPVTFPREGGATSIDRVASLRASEPPARPAPRTPGIPILPDLPPLPATPLAAPSATLSAAPPKPGSKAARLIELRETVLESGKCNQVVESQTYLVCGLGNSEAELMFVGETPAEDEDFQGEAMAGKAGELLTKMIVAMGFARDDVYIANVLKSRPDMPAAGGNRKPTPEEMQTCLNYLKEQIEIIRPRALVALGATAVQGLINNMEPVGKLRGKWLEFQGIPLMVTYHPAYLLRNQSLMEKRKVWEDMLLVLEKLGKPISEKQRAYFTRQ